MKAMTKRLLLAALVGLLLIPAGPAGAQTRKTFSTRLAPVALDVAMQATVTGLGAVSATLNGATLTIDGTFEGLRSPATAAHVHIGRKGVRGPSVFDLKVTAATSGTVTGVLQLTPLQVDALQKGSFYVQLNSEKAPDGNLWGWLTPSEAKK